MNDLSFIQQRLRALMDKGNWTARSLSLKAGLNRVTVANMLVAKKRIDALKLAAVIKTLGISEDEFFQRQAMRRSSDKVSSQEGDHEPPVYVPLLGKIAATPFRLAAASAATRFVPGTHGDAGSFALEVMGDSMAPEYKDKEVVFVRPANVALTPEGDEDAPFIPFEVVSHLHGKDCIILHNGESSLKRLRVQRAKGIKYDVFIDSLNDAYPTIKVRMGDDFFVQGVAYKSEKER